MAVTEIIHDPLIFCADRIDVITNFAVITNVVIKRVHCIFQTEHRKIEFMKQEKYLIIIMIIIEFLSSLSSSSVS